MDLPPEIQCVKHVTRDELRNYGPTNILPHIWFDVGREVGSFIGKQTKYRKEVNNPDGTVDYIFEAFIFSKEEYEKKHGVIIYKEQKQDRSLQLLLAGYILMLAASTITWLIFK